MRIAVLGAATAALVGATLAITPLSTVGTPTASRPACNNGVVGPHCDRLANFLLPETQAHSEAVPAAPVAPPKAIAVPATATPPGGAANVLPAPHAATAAQVVAPRVALPPAVPSAAVPGVGAPGVPGQPLGTVPGVPGQAAAPGVPDLPNAGLPSDLNDLLNQGYSLVNGVIATNAAVNSIGPIVGSVAGVAGVTGSVASAGLGLLTTLAILNRGSDLTGAGKLVSMLVPTVGLPALTSVLPTVGPTGLPALPAVGLPKLPAGLPSLPGGLPSLPGGLPSLPGGIAAVGAALPAIDGALHSLPPLPMPQVGLPEIHMPSICISTPIHQC